MATWKEEVSLSGLHRLYEKQNISVEALGRAVAARLRATSLYSTNDQVFKDIVGEFGFLNKLSNLKDYETILDMLYDYGDRDRKLWIDASEEYMGDPTTIVNKENGNAVQSKSTYYNRSPESSTYPYSSSPTTSSSSSRRSRHNEHTAAYTTTPWALEQKLRTKNIDKDKVPYDLFEHLRRSSEDFQDWLLDSCLTFSSKEINKSI